MDVFVGDIPSWATSEQVEDQIAAALHTPPVRHKRQEELVNFGIFIPKRPDGSLQGHAYLSIPEYTTAERLVRKCSSGQIERPVWISNEKGRTALLKFRLNSLLRPAQLEKLKAEPYVSSAARREQEQEVQREKERQKREAKKKDEKRKMRLEEEAQRMREGVKERERLRRLEEEKRRKRRAQEKREKELPEPAEEPKSRTKKDILAHALSPTKQVTGPNDQARKASPPSSDSAESRFSSNPLTSSSTPLRSSSPTPSPVPVTHSRRKGAPVQKERPVYGRPGSWKSIQFGLICDDGSFSIEDEETLAKPLPAGFDEHYQTMILGDEANAVKILYNSVVRWSIQDDAVLFELENPATFIKDGKTSSYWNFRDGAASRLAERRDYRTPYTGSTFQVVFTSPSELDEFLLHGRRLLVRAGLPSEPRRFVRRNLLSAKYFERLQEFCAGLGIPLAFQCERLFLNGLLQPSAIYELELLVSRSVADRGEELTAKLVQNLITGIQRRLALYKNEPSSHAPKLKEAFIYEAGRLEKSEKAFKNDRLSIDLGATFEVYHATVTPTRALLAGPVVDTSNRVLRLFPHHTHHFLRVAFTDEDFDRFPVGRRDLRGVDSESFVHERVGGILKQGIRIAGRKWDMLAWSGSSIGTHQCWFSTPFTDDRGLWDAQKIRDSLGDFSQVELYPARYGARLSQAFSATAPTIEVEEGQIEIIDDIKSPTGHLFTDGVGQISPKLMQAV